MMKALTIHQPWASLIMLGAKPYEFRTWDYRRRYPDVQGQTIVIHAATRPIRQDEVIELMERLDDDLPPVDPTIARQLLKRLLAAYKCRGVVEMAAGLGMAMIGAPILCTELYPDDDRIDPDMWAWPMQEIMPWGIPIPIPGRQGFWNWPEAA